MISVIIASGGDSTRMKGINKQMAKIQDKPIIIHSLLTFNSLDEVDEIILISKENMIDTMKLLIDEYKINKVTAVIAGGKTRQESVFNGFKNVNMNNELIIIHDGARPLVLKCDILKCIDNARKYSNSALGKNIVDTIKKVDNGFIVDTINRDELIMIQTPQVFNMGLYKKAVENAMLNNLDFTDDTKLMESIGENVNITIATNSNIKVTIPEDLLYIEFLMSKNIQGE